MRFRATISLSTLAIVLAGCPLSQQVSQPAARSAVETEPLQQRLSETLSENLRTRGLSTELHGSWQILHGILAYGDQFEIDTPTGRQGAIQYLQAGGSILGFDPAPGDRLGPSRRVGIRLDIQPETKVGQGHRDQWLAVLAQSGLDAQAELQIGEQAFTIRDWVRQAQYDVPLNYEREYSWTLIALTAYDDTDHSWQARDGETYNTASILGAEVRQDLAASVCGGTHRLIGIAMALNKRKAEGAPITGVWQSAQEKIDEAIDLAKRNQNPDGSYSVAYHHRTGWTRDLGEALGTTGHVLEFLAIAAPEETLRESWVRRSALRICDILDQCRDVDLECGVLYHALHGLSEYQARMFR